MPSTHTCLNYHIIFGTKNRKRQIVPAWRPQLHDYLGGIIRGLGGFPKGIGGVEDHVHLLLELKPTHLVSDVVRDIKKSSSKWVHQKQGDHLFGWQDGYAAFTVSIPSLPALQHYVANQEAHHRKKTFLEELQEIYDKAGIAYDPRFL